MRYYYVANPELGETQGQFSDLEDLFVTLNNGLMPDGKYKIERLSPSSGKREFVMYYTIEHEE